MDKASVVVVKKFLEADGGKSVGMTEMTIFWKSCTDDEKLQFTREAVALHPELAR